MKILNLLILVLVLSFTSCSDDKTIVTEINRASDAYELSLMSSNIESDVQDGKVLSNSNSSEKLKILKLVKETKNLVISLGRFGNSHSSVVSIFENINEYQNIFILEEDQRSLDIFFDKAYEITVDFANKFGISIQSNLWKQFSYDFSEGVSPFGIHTDGAVDWSVDFQQGEPVILVKGTGFSSWLISPEFDLANVSNATFSFSQLIGLDKNNRETSVEFNRAKFLRENFKILISTDYDGADPSSASWDRIIMSKSPTSLNFNKVMSEDYNLGRYLGKKITIAFFYDGSSDKVGRHYLNWNIYKFILKANNRIPKIEKRAAPLLVEKFSGSLNDFNSLKITHDSPVWAYSRGGGNEFAVINSNGKNTSAWLISNRYKIQNIQNGLLNIKQVARNLDLKKAKIKISTDYNGGNPLNATWTSVAHSYSTDVIDDNWTTFSSELVDLSAYDGKDIVVGFEFSQDAEDSSTWEIVSLNFIGEGSKIGKTKIQYTYADPIDPNLGDVISSFDFVADFSSMSTQVTSGNGASFFVNTRGTPSVRISGFKDKNVGTSRLMIKNIDLAGLSNPSFILSHSLNFVKDIAADKLTKVFIRVSSQENEEQLFLENYPLGNSFDVFTSGPYFFSSSYLSQKVDLIFQYESLEGNFTTWDLLNLKVMEN